MSQQELLNRRKERFRESYNMKWSQFESVAINDFSYMMKKWKIDATENTKRNLLIQSGSGHAQNGHGAYAFANMFLPEVEVEDVCIALGFDPSHIKRERMNILDDIEDLVHRILAGDKIKKIKNTNGEPIGGITCFKKLKVDPAKSDDLLKGLALGGLMDNYDRRSRISQILRDEGAESMGGGQCVAVDRFKLEEMAETTGKNFYYSIEGLANMAHTKEQITQLETDGVIIRKDIESNIRMISAYVREEKGEGGSDNSGIVGGFKLYNSLEVSVGIYLADLDDTLDKFIPTIYNRGHDEKMAHLILKERPGIITDTELDRLIYCTAISNFKDKENLHDDSQRKMLQRFKHNSRVQDYFEYAATGATGRNGLFYAEVDAKVARAKKIFKD